MNASIITIGDELLIGQVIDTNSAFIAEELNLQGISVKRILTVGDNYNDVISALEICSDSPLIISTGGLGPTRDDITKDVLCSFFNTKLVRNQSVLENVKLFLNNRGVNSINDNNLKQADVPESAEIFSNINGTAPGLWFKKNNSVFVFLPGVPHEMKSIFINELIPFFANKFSNQAVVHRTIHTFGSFEANLAEILDVWVNELPLNIKPAFLPSSGIIRIRLTGIGPNKTELEKVIEKEIEKLVTIIPDIIFSTHAESMELVVGNILKKCNKTVGTAESCTGGSIAALFTKIPGSSIYFKGGVIAYSNSVKVNQLNVRSKDIEQFGAVSEQVVKQMAENLRSILNTDYCIATSGIAGPDGGTETKPVGTTWIAIAGPDKTVCRNYAFSNRRELNIRKTVLTAMDLLRQELVLCTKKVV